MHADAIRFRFFIFSSLVSIPLEMCGSRFVHFHKWSVSVLPRSRFSWKLRFCMFYAMNTNENVAHGREWRNKETCINVLCGRNVFGADDGASSAVGDGGTAHTFKCNVYLFRFMFVSHKSEHFLVVCSFQWLTVAIRVSPYAYGTMRHIIDEKNIEFLFFFVSLTRALTVPAY